MFYKFIVKWGQECGLKCGGRLSKHIYISGLAINFIPLFSLDNCLAHPEVRKIEFNNSSIYEFNKIITLTFKTPEPKHRSCLWRSAICFKKLFIALITANGMKDFRAVLVNKDRCPSFSTKILLNCLGENQFYTSS